MSPASESKLSKDKKVSKEPQKVSSRPSVAAAAGSGVPASAYNPHWGTFHTLEAVPTLSVSPLQLNGRFRNMEETDEQDGSSLGTGVECDSISNNGSWSGESEEHKEKSTARQETIPPGMDNEKREKIRQKNEKKHQRQKEKRAQELHERCCGYLMSRKLEALAQQLVSMGFSHERAIMALMLNEGRVEESVAWLFEAAEEDNNQMDPNLCHTNLKIDISEELSGLVRMESSYKTSKQEVERAVVSCEGDLEKAAETLKKMKQDLPPGASKPGETGDPATLSNGKLSVSAVQNSKKPLPRPMQPRRDDRVYDMKVSATAVGESRDHGSKHVQAPLKRTQPKLEWAKPPPTAVPTADKRWPAAGLNPVSYSLASSLQASLPPTKRHVSVESELKNLQLGSVTEPVMMMQRPQCAANGKQGPVSSSVSSSFRGAAAIGWHPSNGNGLTSQVTSTDGGGLSSNQSYQLQYQHQFGPRTNLADVSGRLGWGDLYGSGQGNSSWSSSRAGLSAASSLGLFSGLGSSAGSSSGHASPVDWNNGGSTTVPVDYSNVDWTLDRGGGSSFPKSSSNLMIQEQQQWLIQSVMNSSGAYNHLHPPRVEAKSSVRTVTMMTMGKGKGKGKGTSMARSFPDGGVGLEASGAGGVGEWTSPFGGKDLFSLPRHFVSSPSL